MDGKLLIYSSRALAFVLICVLAFGLGITPKEIVWGLYISSMVSGTVALILPLWALLLFPGLDKKLFPNHEPPDFTIFGRVFACLFLLLLLIGPFLFFMALFTPFMIEAVVVEGMPSADQPWPAFYLWAAREFWFLVAVTTASVLYESTVRLIRLDNSAFFRPWALVVKMFLIVVLSNFGYAAWTIIPLVAILQIPEGFITRWGGRAMKRQAASRSSRNNPGRSGP